MKGTLSLLFFFISLNLLASSELNSCRLSKKLFTRKLSLHIECNKGHLIFCRNTATNRSKGCARKHRIKTTGIHQDLKIAGFNLLNLGMGQDLFHNRATAIKNNQALAYVINQFDIVAAVEIKHQPIEDYQFNKQIKKHLDSTRPLYLETNSGTKKKLTKAQMKKHLRVPAYLLVLKELIKRDPSWTLVLATDLFSSKKDDWLNNEVAGYFFRHRAVNIVETEYCDAIACVAKKSEFKAEVAKKPFLASFEAKDLSFTMAAMHFRYGAPTKKDSDGKLVFDQATYNKMLKVYDIEKHLGQVFSRSSSGGETNAAREYKARLSETKSVANFLGKLTKNSAEKDIILYGDFNLPAPTSTRRGTKRQRAYAKAWTSSKGLLENWKNARPYINDLTTLGANELANEYDHFVMVKDGDLESCDYQNARAYDFTKNDDFPLLDEIIEKRTVNKVKNLFNKELKFSNDHENLLVKRNTPNRLEYFSDRQRDILDALGTNDNIAYKLSISDHLPIAIDCSKAL